MRSYKKPTKRPTGRHGSVATFIKVLTVVARIVHWNKTPESSKMQLQNWQRCCRTNTPNWVPMKCKPTSPATMGVRCRAVISKPFQRWWAHWHKPRKKAGIISKGQPAWLVIIPNFTTLWKQCGRSHYATMACLPTSIISDSFGLQEFQSQVGWHFDFLGHGKNNNFHPRVIVNYQKLLIMSLEIICQ